MSLSKNFTTLYYLLKPLIPRGSQIWFRSNYVQLKRKWYQSTWPILEESGRAPHGWQGWPEQKRFALVLTHDVDTARGQDRCMALMKLEKELGFRSAFYFVPERYRVHMDLQKALLANEFEVGVHGLNHDGKLYQSRKIFHARAIKINEYLKAWGAVGFRSPAMHHNLDWIHELDIQYDASTFDTDPFEAQPDGVRTIFPFWVPNPAQQDGYVELPYSLAQDFTLFILMGQKNIDIWKAKLDWIADKGGMALVITHPDYMNFGVNNLTLEEYPADYYRGLLEYIEEKYHGLYWHVLPKQIARFWLSRADYKSQSRSVYKASV